MYDVILNSLKMSGLGHIMSWAGFSMFVSNHRLKTCPNLNSGGLLLDGTLGIFQSHYIYTWTDYVYIYIYINIIRFNII